MRGAAIAVCLGLASGAAHAVEPTAAVSFSSGIRPLSLPLSAGLGGGLRAGLVFGPVMPFVGGSASLVSVSETDRNPRSVTTASLYTAQLGIRGRVVQLDAAETWLVGGALLSNAGGRSLWDVDAPRGSGTRIPVGPGVFAGGGADAWLTERVSLGVEAGLAWASGKVVSQWVDGSSVDTQTTGEGSSALFGYSSLGFTLWLGGGE